MHFLVHAYYYCVVTGGHCVVICTVKTHIPVLF